MLHVREHRYVPQRQPRHAHRETTITIVLAGALHERVGSREEVALPLSIVVKPRDTDHCTEFGTTVRTVQIVVPERDAVDLEHAGDEFRSWRWHHMPRAVPAFLRLVRAFRAAVDVECAIYEALGAIRAEPVASGNAPQWVARVREAIDDSPTAASVGALARSANVHPVYLARRFRRWFGCSITEYKARVRVQRAAAAIANGDHALSTIAYATGFSDQSHLSRFFARETGLTPARYRALTAR